MTAVTAMRAEAMTGAGSGERGSHPGATLALAALTTVAAASLSRYQAERWFVGSVVATGLVAHGVAWARRRRRLTARLPLTAMAMGLLVAWTVLPETTAYGVPTTTTLTSALAAVGRALEAFGSVTPGGIDPVGLVIVLMALTGAGAVVADRAAFGMQQPFLAMGPSVALFVVGAIGRSPSHRGAAIAAFLAVALVFLAEHERDVRSGVTAWFEPRPRRPALAMRPSLVLGVVVIAGALVLGPLVPGSGIRLESAVSGPGPSAAPADGFEVSDLVDIRGTLSERSNVEVFSVSSSVPSYWRLTSLDRFDGSTWSSSGTSPDVIPPGGLPVSTTGELVVQDFSLGALTSPTLPAAYELVDVNGLRASYDAGTATLTRQDPPSAARAYRAVSVAHRPDPAALSRASWGVPADIAGRNLELPGDLPPAVVDEARRVTARASTPGPYGAALALQDYFRRSFTYDLSAAPGHGSQALERFLFTTRRGYCEQFAGAFAAMARSVGLATRVAVGFTPGTPGNDGRYHVRGLNAHAWPEVYLAGSGWLPFEPTPARAVPGGEGYTGVPDSEMAADDPASTTVPVGSPTTQAAPGAPSTPTSTSAARAGSATPDPGPTGQAGGQPSKLTSVLLAILLVVGPVAAVPQLKRRQRRLRRARAVGANDRVLVAWTEASEALAWNGARRRRDETLTEFAGRAPDDARLSPGSTASLATLVALANVASYGSGDVAADQAQAAVRASAGLVGDLHGQASVAARMARAVDPRPIRPLASK